MSAGRAKRQALFDKQDGKCHYCDIQMTMEGKGRFLCTVDHIIPKSAGGTLYHTNIVGACRSCNNARGSQPYEEFKTRIRFKGSPLSEKRAKRLRRKHENALKKAIMESDAPWTRRRMKSCGVLIDVYKGNSIEEALREAEATQGERAERFVEPKKEEA